MTKYEVDTNAGPIVTREASSVAQMRSWVESMIPLLQRRGYTAKWTRSGHWHVCNVHNSRGRLVHACAFRAVSRANYTHSDGRRHAAGHCSCPSVNR